VDLRLTVQPPAGRSRDLVIEVEPFAPMRALLDALAQDIGLPAHEIGAATLARGNRRLQPGDPVASADLRDGDVLALEMADPDAPTYTPVPQEDGGVIADLVVVGGPLMGTRVALVPGTHVVGRGPGADVVLADGSLSRRHLQVAVAADGIEVRDLGSSNGTFIEGVALAAPRQLSNGEPVEAGRSLIAFEARDRHSEDRPGDGQGGVPFNRPPRVARPKHDRKLSLPAPPKAPLPSRIPVVPALVPLGLAGVMWAVTGSPLMLMVGVLTPTMALYNWYEGRRRGKDTHAGDAKAFRERVSEVARELE
jgi:DNA segregation ATPase FtsK/SpoIIIE, S-DNA-T family